MVIWFLLLHISALLIWAAGVLYVPVVLAGAAKSANEFASNPPSHDSVARFVFTHIATPAALVAIVAGTIVFLLNQTTEFWLVAKLTLVTLLVFTHAFLGLLITRAERKQYQYMRLMSWVSSVILALLMLLIIWLVLAKPGVPEVLPWTL